MRFGDSKSVHKPYLYIMEIERLFPKENIEVYLVEINSATGRSVTVRRNLNDWGKRQFLPTSGNYYNN